MLYPLARLYNAQYHSLAVHVVSKKNGDKHLILSLDAVTDIARKEGKKRLSSQLASHTLSSLFGAGQKPLQACPIASQSRLWVLGPEELRVSPAPHAEFLMPPTTASDKAADSAAGDIVRLVARRLSVWDLSSGREASRVEHCRRSSS